MNYKVGNCGLVIGLIDNQSDVSSEELFEKEFKNGIFKGYKDELKSIGGNIGDDLYVPCGYHLFGDCNMTVLSLIDDYAFANRVLHTSHGYTTDPNNEYKYTLQIVNGIHTQADLLEIPSLETQARNTFLRKKDRYPFIGITQYKINNGLLIGNGVELLEMIKLALYRLREKNITCHPIELICIDSFSNNELVVVYFARKLSDISFFTNETRKLKLNQLAEGLEAPAQEKIHTFTENSLLYRCLCETLQKTEGDEAQKEIKQPTEAEKKEYRDQIQDSHVFSTTFSHLGYDMNPSCKEALEDYGEQHTFQYHWDLKPGHYDQFKKAVFEGEQPIFKEKGGGEEHLMPGVDMTQWLAKDILLKEYLDQLEKLNRPAVKEYVRKQRVNVIFPAHISDNLPLNREDHPQLVKYLGNCRFSKQELRKLRDDLNECRISKVLKERTLKMYGTFNDCITDPLFFSSFIELENYLIGIKTDIRNYREKTGEKASLEEVHTWLDSMIRNFEQAYYNRFHHSSRMRNISDFNLEYNGGIQQQVSAYDTAYKVILKEWAEEGADRNFVYVSGYERVSSDKYSLRINNFHITYPELYAATIWKEAINFYWEKNLTSESDTLSQIHIAQNTPLVLQPDCVKVLKNRTLFNPAYNPTKYVHKVMYNSINHHFIHYLLADVWVFNNGYLGDFNLFTFWYWNYFSQMSHFYNQEGEMVPEIFVKFLMRWLFIKYFSGQEEECYEPFDPKLAELWQCHINDAKEFISLFIKELDKLDFMHYADAIGGMFHFRQFGLEEKINQELEEKKIKEIENYIVSLSEELLRQKEEFNNGFIIIPNQDTKDHFFFIRNLMVSYLTVMKELSEAENKNIRILERDEKGKMINRKHYQPLLADPLGGMFICDNTQRGKYFKFRSIFYKSLWGASLEIKRDHAFTYLKGGATSATET